MRRQGSPGLVRSSVPRVVAATIALGACAGLPAAGAGPAEAAALERRARSILADACFPCHGPDAGKRKAELRLDVEPGGRAARDGRRLVVPGDPSASEVFLRLTAA